MKTAYLTQNKNIVIDEATNEVSELYDIGRYNINRIYKISEPTHIVYGSGEDKRELHADDGDIVITFDVNDYTPNKVIIINSKEWVENIKGHEARVQKEKEEWAQRNAPCCDNCECKSSL